MQKKQQHCKRTTSFGGILLPTVPSRRICCKSEVFPIPCTPTIINLSRVYGRELQQKNNQRYCLPMFQFLFSDISKGNIRSYKRLKDQQELHKFSSNLNFFSPENNSIAWMQSLLIYNKMKKNQK